MGELSVVDRERLRSAIVDRSEIRAQLAHQWVRELNRVAVEIATKGTVASADTMTVFWIRLHGVLVEVGGSYEDICKIADDCGAANTPLARDSRVVRDTLHALRDSMSEDERMWLHYRRDVECHVWQDAYELNRKGNGLKEKRRFALLGGQEMHIDEIAKRSSALIRKYNVDEPAMAVHFAKLVAPHVARVLLALAPLYRSA